MAKSGYTCISATLRSTGNQDVVAIGGGLHNDLVTFIGSAKNISNWKPHPVPLVSCVYIKNS